MGSNKSVNDKINTAKKISKGKVKSSLKSGCKIKKSK